ncbi:MAG: XdhC family protein [Oscillibacter sp.]|jgi:xanthine dehydrogenase accessory factor|nr:XdhC family protein [Oscillibacter sp.]
MRKFFRSIVHALEGGERVVLVSILTSSGSTPRGTGAMMAVFQDGSITGTIGGGNVEFTAQKRAAELLESGGKDEVNAYRFVPGDAASLGMVCGGDVTVHLQLLTPENKSAITVFRALIDASGSNTGAWLVRHLDGAEVTQMRCAVTADRENAQLAVLLQDKPLLTADGWFSIPVERPGCVYIFGGGHVSQALVNVIAPVGFRTVVLDDREEFADKARFPLADRTLCGSFLELCKAIAVTEDDYVVIMTRGHQADYEALCGTLRSGAKYLGCIGSRKKLALCRERLMEAGYTPEEYARVHAPIGLAIGAETPEEIAVAIAAELIAVRSGVQR